MKAITLQCLKGAAGGGLSSHFHQFLFLNGISNSFHCNYLTSVLKYFSPNFVTITILSRNPHSKPLCDIACHKICNDAGKGIRCRIAI